MLDNTIKLYVPSTQGADGRISNQDHRARLLEVQQVFSKMFGGSTALRGMGSWFSTDLNKTIIEDVFVVECKTSAETLNEKLEELYAIQGWYKSEWKQESIALEINGALNL